MPEHIGYEDTDYKFTYADPGMFFEIYVPTVYEEQMREALLKGFDLEYVQRYLKNPANKVRICRLLEENERLKDYTDTAVDQLERVLKGFSIYRVDGSFSDGKTIQSEQVSIVRLMFMPELTKEPADRLKAERFWAREYLRFWTHHLDAYLRDRDVGSDELALLKKLEKWLDDIDLVVNGYVIDRLCCEVKWRKQKGLTQKLEDEIWIGSLRTLAVNKVVLNEERGRQPLTQP